MEELYTDKTYINLTIKVLQDSLDDLDMVSVYNKDKYLEQIINITTAIREIKKIK